MHAGYFQINSGWSSRFSTEIGIRLENTNTKSKYGSANQDTTLTKIIYTFFPL
ncbi:MAG: hypothetical protein LUD02_04740 [Tannerellaceae bacterium]|nr:hypothetical protein [Tannerellaceae bacterium]